VRNPCADADCLIAKYTERNRQLSSAPGAVACPVKESDLIGSWTRAKDGFFEEFALARDGGERSFSSWLHHRPEMTGTWALEHCALRIDNPYNPQLSFQYKVVGLTNGRLQLQDLNDASRSSYQKGRGP
jgi:hypothetical protein